MKTLTLTLSLSKGEGGRWCFFSSLLEHQRQIATAEALGFDLLVTLEPEFFVLNEDESSLRDGAFASLGPFAKDNRC